MAAFVTRAYDLDDSDPPHGYSDVSPTNIFRDNIAALKNAGILTSDCSEGEGSVLPVLAYRSRRSSRVAVHGLSA